MFKRRARQLAVLGLFSLPFVVALAVNFWPSGPPESVARHRPSQDASLSSPVSRWSDPLTWGGRLPRAGANVTIPEGVSVLLDVSPPPLKTLYVWGNLVFDRQDLSLTLDAIQVYGGLEAGTPEQPFLQRAVIAFTGAKGHDGQHASAKGISVVTGRLDLHGEPREPSWTRLAATAVAGSNNLVLEQAVSWRPGDHIVIASTSRDPAQAEEHVIERVEGNTLTLTQPLRYGHAAETLWLEGVPIDQQAEVGLLSRSILIKGDRAPENDGLGGYTMYMPTTRIRISWTEFFHMGQKGELARYPIHFHLAGEMSGSYIRNNSIHHSFNRCLTIHGSHGVLAEGNVAYDAIGHCYFFEDGIETGNVLRSNLGILTRAPDKDYALLESDLTPATYWISNPDNVFLANVAAGSESRGFWFDPPLHPTGLSQSAETDARVWPRRTPLREFSDNVSHSNAGTGLLVGSSGEGFALVPFTPRTNPVPPAANAADSAPVMAVFSRLLAYSNGDGSVRLLGEPLQLDDARLDDWGAE